MPKEISGRSEASCIDSTAAVNAGGVLSFSGACDERALSREAARALRSAGADSVRKVEDPSLLFTRPKAIEAVMT